MKDRYFVDVRVGCAAVRDRQHPDYDESYPGLHWYTKDVIAYKHGMSVVSEEDVKELEELCDKLNVWPNRNKQLEKLGI